MKDDLASLTLLGNTRTKYPVHPREAQIETFPIDPDHTVSVVTFNCEGEFTSLCEKTGQPDFGSIEISYLPDEKVLESKSLKLLLFSYRNVNMFYEKIVMDLLGRLVEVVEPKWMQVTATMAPRGGISLSATALYPKPPID